MHGFWGEQPQAWYKMLRMEHHTVAVLMKAASNYSELILYFVYAAILIYAIFMKDKDKIFFIFRFSGVAVMYSLILTQLLKASFRMPRPGHSLPRQPFSFLHDYSSFPSGHTVAIITAALPLALWINKGKWYIVLSLLVASVGVSRLWLGAHHQVDILGGIVVGSLAARAGLYRQK